MAIDIVGRTEAWNYVVVKPEELKALEADLNEALALLREELDESCCVCPHGKEGACWNCRTLALLAKHDTKEGT